MNRYPRAGGFSMPELLVTTVILGLIAAVGGGSFITIARRERVTAVTSELSGWLDQVNGDARRFNALVDSQGQNETCTVTITTGTDLTAGTVLARIEPRDCATQDTLTVPDLYSKGPTVQITATPSQFVFTPRGTVATTNGAALPNGEVQITLSVNSQLPLRCIRLVGLIGVLEVGRNNQAANGACIERGRV
jgi:prepilin-type N-terminal cleavage/methylation domain-containing protein